MKKLLVSMMLILGMLAFAAESAPSSTVGYVKYSNVVNATLADYNQIAVPMDCGWVTNADIDPASTNISAMSKWDAVNQTYLASNYVFGSWKTTFSVNVSDVVTVNAKVAHDIIVDGPVVTAPAYNLIVNAANSDYNDLMMPLDQSALSTSALLGADIGSANTNSIQQWDALTQTYLVSNFVFGSWKTPFDLEIGDPMTVNMVAATTWPSAKQGENSITELAPEGVKGGPARTLYAFLSDGTNPYPLAAGGTSLTWWATITSSPADTLRWNSASYAWEDVAGDGNLSVSLPINEFAGTWVGGDVLTLTVKDEVSGMEGTVACTLDADGSAYLVGFDNYYGVAFDNAIAPSNDPLSITVLSSIDGNVPMETKLEQNYPNPFNPTTTINFSLNSEGIAKLNVYNYTGQLVNSLVNGQMNVGNHTVNFDASSLSAGVYYYTLEANGVTMTKKMVLVK